MAASLHQRLLIPAAVFFGLLSWLMPTHQLPWTSFHSEVAMVTAAFFVLLDLILRSWGRHITVFSFAALTMAAAVIPWLQVATGLMAYYGDAALVSLYLFGFAWIQVVGGGMRQAWSISHLMEILAWVLITGALLSVWLALYQWQGLGYLGGLTDPMPSMGRVIANLNQPNHLATLLVLALGAVVYFYAAAKFNGTIAIALVVVFGFGLSMTQSRAGLAELAVAGLLLIFKRDAIGSRLSPKRVLLTLAVLFMLSTVWQLVSPFSPEVAQRDGDEAAQASNIRIAHWASMLDAMQRQPWFGYGWIGTTAALFTVAPDHEATRQILSYSHNLFIDLLVWNGIPVGLLLIGGTVTWFVSAIRTARDLATVIAVVCVTVVFIHALLEFPLYFTYFLLPVGFLMGAVSAGSMSQASFRAPFAVLPMVGVSLMAAVACVVFDYLNFEEDMSVLRHRQARIGIHKPAPPPSKPVMLTQLDAFMRFAMNPEREHMSREELDEMGRVAQRFLSGGNIVRHAAALALNQRPDEASLALQHVCKLEIEKTCKNLEAVWQHLGEKNPLIASVAWPSK